MVGKRSIIVFLAALALVGAGVALAGRDEAPRPALGLFSSLPIAWGEADDLAGLLRPDQPPHWARGLLERRYRLRPLDVLDGVEAKGLAYLLIAQPRPLAPQENVALDAWVRGGGRLLLFADPMLTAHSAFPLGDPRRPQDIVLLSPILARWGLRLEFDEDQPAGEREADLDGGALPVDLPGRFSLVRTPDSIGTCRLLADGLAAECAIGGGHALILADAALLDTPGESSDARAAALTRLLDRAFAGRAGNHGDHDS